MLVFSLSSMLNCTFSSLSQCCVLGHFESAYVSSTHHPPAAAQSTVSGVAGPMVYEPTLPNRTNPYQEPARSNGLSIKQSNMILFMPNQLRYETRVERYIVRRLPVVLIHDVAVAFGPTTHTLRARLAQMMTGTHACEENGLRCTQGHSLLLSFISCNRGSFWTREEHHRALSL